MAQVERREQAGFDRRREFGERDLQVGQFAEQGGVGGAGAVAVRSCAMVPSRIGSVKCPQVWA
jgi:hypothetical protein